MNTTPDQSEPMDNEENDTEMMSDHDANTGGAPSCCGGTGTCLGSDLIPDEQEDNLRTCRREGHRDLMCVPNDFLDPSWVPQTCTGGGLLGDYEGVCLPDCLRLPFEFTLDQRPCADGYVCAPCVRPLSGEPSGAPGCPDQP